MDRAEGKVSVRDFFDLHISEQLKILEYCGSVIAMRETDQHRIVLYGLLEVYVEVWFLQRTSEPLLCREVTGITLLELYVQHLDWKDLL